MTDIPDELLHRLKVTRKNKKLSQRELAKMTSVQQAQISHIESGQIDPRLSTLRSILHALDLELIAVPRQSVATINHIIHGTQTPDASTKPLYSLGDDDA